MVACVLDNALDGDGGSLTADAHGATDDTLRQCKVYLGIVDQAVSHQRCDNTFQITNALIHRLRDVINDRCGNLQAIATNLVEQDITAQRSVGRLQFSQQTPLEAREQSLFHPLQSHRRAVGSQDELATVLMQVIEDMEESKLCLLQRCELLNIIDDEDIDVLIEIDEVVDGVLTHTVGILNLEQVGGDVEDPQLGMQFLQTQTNRIHQVCLTGAGASIDEERIEGGLLGILCDGKTHGARQLVGLAFDEVLKGVIRTQL